MIFEEAHFCIRSVISWFLSASHVTATGFGLYRGPVKDDVKGSVLVFFWKFHHRGERGRKGWECKFPKIEHRTFDILLYWPPVESKSKILHRYSHSPSVHDSWKERGARGGVNINDPAVEGGSISGHVQSRKDP